MKVGIHIFVLFVFGSNLQSAAQTNAKQQTDVEREHLKGRVKQYISESFATESTYSPKPGTKKVVDTFRWKRFATESNIYNVKGQIIEQNSSMILMQHEIKLKLIFIYDDKGNNVERDEYSPEELFGKDLMGYDDKGNRISDMMIQLNRLTPKKNKLGNSKYTTGVKDTLCTKWVYKYDSVGNIVEKDQYRDDGALEFTELYKYDSSGRVTDYSRSGYGSYNAFICIYDHKGNEVKEDFYGNSGLMDSHLNKYDSNDNKIEQIDTNYGEYSSLSHTRKYDNMGNEEETIYNKYSDVYQYEYDTHGNWIKKIEFITGSHEKEEKWNKIVRKIEYYPEE